MPQYSKPPITEAVIEFQFEGECPDQARAKITRKLRKRYPVEEIMQEMLFQGSSTLVSHSVTPIGFKLSSQDRTEIVTLTNTGTAPGLPVNRSAALSTSQLAPYHGWDSFATRFLEAWDIVEKALHRRKVTRMGVRFINRIDIPGALDDAGRWVRIAPDMPQELPMPVAFSVNTVLPLDSDTHANVGMTVVNPVLPFHSAILLDIDVYWISPIPDLHDGRAEILNSLHNKKNLIFETCITDETRQLFK